MRRPASPKPNVLCDHAHQPEPDEPELTLAELLTAAAFGALVVVVVLICYVLLVLWLAWAAPPVPVAP